MTSSSYSGDLKELFYVLGLAFIQIRATDNLEHAQILADIFHNVPAKVSCGFELTAIMQEISEKAERHGYENRVAKMFDAARQNSPK
jgi:hypothetical protein